MKKSKVLMFVNFVIIVISIFTVIQAVEITKYLISIAPYETLIFGEVISYYSSVITYLFEVGILAILCIIYKHKLVNETIKEKEDKENIKEEVPIEPTNFVWENQHTDIEELTKQMKVLENRLDQSIKNNENVVDKSKVKTENTLTTEEEKKIQKELNKAINNYEDNEIKQMEKELNKAIAKYDNKKKDVKTEDLEKELNKILSDHTTRDPKVPTTRMTKDELLKCAAWNDVYATEDMTKAEIMDAINKKIKPKSKTKKK